MQQLALGITWHDLSCEGKNGMLDVSKGYPLPLWTATLPGQTADSLGCHANGIMAYSVFRSVSGEVGRLLPTGVRRWSESHFL